MKQVRLNIPLKILLIVFVLFNFAYYAVTILLFQHECWNRFNIGRYENVTYFLQKYDVRPSFSTDLEIEIDYKNLIDINFTFTVNLSAFICNETAPLLLILVHSAPGNYAKRKTIRETWGKSAGNVKVIFLLGTPNDNMTKFDLWNENFMHRDLLQGSFIDSYRNMTYKHVMGLKFVVYHCSQAKYVLKVDDDTCVNTPLLKNFLIRDLSPYGAKKLLMCNVVRQARTFRSFRSKWRVTLNEYRQRSYPTYCLGWYILYSPDVIFQLYQEAQRTRYFWIDDVFVTGMVASKLNFVNHTDIAALTLSKSEIKSINYDQLSKCKPFLFGRADMREDEIRSLWEHIVKNPVPLSTV